MKRRFRQLLIIMAGPAIVRKPCVSALKAEREVFCRY